MYEFPLKILGKSPDHRGMDSRRDYRRGMNVRSHQIVVRIRRLRPGDVKK